MKSLLFFAGLIQMCNALGIGIDLPSLLPLSLYIGILVFVLIIISYIFYPAYKSAEGGLGCAVTILSGNGGGDEGEAIFFMLHVTIFYHTSLSLTA